MKWPDREIVHQAIEAWAKRLQDAQPNVQQVGYFGSYARGDWGVESDVDVVLVVEGASENGEVRGTDVDATGLPGPADILVYTVDERNALQGRDARGNPARGGLGDRAGVEHGLSHVERTP
jgi:hypothetical protein